jgi:hypothetical protein
LGAPLGPPPPAPPDWIISVSSGADPETVGDQFPRIEPVG